MQRVKISLPAVVTHIAPALAGLGLAFGLRMNVEITERDNDDWIVETLGVRDEQVVILIGTEQRLSYPVQARLGLETIFPGSSGLDAFATLHNPARKP